MLEIKSEQVIFSNLLWWHSNLDQVGFSRTKTSMSPFPVFPWHLRQNSWSELTASMWVAEEWKWPNSSRAHYLHLPSAAHWFHSSNPTSGTSCSDLYILKNGLKKLCFFHIFSMTIWKQNIIFFLTFKAAWTSCIRSDRFHFSTLSKHNVSLSDHMATCSKRFNNNKGNHKRFSSKSLPKVQGTPSKKEGLKTAEFQIKDMLWENKTVNVKQSFLAGRVPSCGINSLLPSSLPFRKM